MRAAIGFIIYFVGAAPTINNARSAARRMKIIASLLLTRHLVDGAFRFIILKARDTSPFIGEHTTDSALDLNNFRFRGITKCGGDRLRQHRRRRPSSTSALIGGDILGTDIPRRNQFILRRAAMMFIFVEICR